jgi:ribonuclease P protein component
VAKQFTLGKNERLKSRKQIEQLFSEGKKFTVTAFRVFYLIRETLNNQHSMISKGPAGLPWRVHADNIQFAVGVSSKNFKRAVDRNRIKRLTKEAYRLQNNELKEKLIKTGRQLNVFFIYTAKELPDFYLVKDKVAVALKKLLKLADENASADS